MNETNQWKHGASSQVWTWLKKKEPKDCNTCRANEVVPATAEIRCQSTTNSQYCKMWTLKTLSNTDWQKWEWFSLAHKYIY